MINILDLIYPPVCGICGNIYKVNLCPKCNVIIKKYEISKKINNQNNNFNEMINIFKYEGIIRQKIIEYKFQNKPYLYKTFAEIILKNKKICGFLEKYDIIIPVPVHKKRKSERGYNQTELIAKEIAKRTNLKMDKNILIKQKNTISQSKLNKVERKQNVENAFIINKTNNLISNNVLLFDDIYTTGSTVSQCCKVLKSAGAKQIGILTIAKD